MRRNYRKEYDNYDSKPDQKKNAPKTRQGMMEKEGKVSG